MRKWKIIARNENGICINPFSVNKIPKQRREYHYGEKERRKEVIRERQTDNRVGKRETDR